MIYVHNPQFSPERHGMLSYSLFLSQKLTWSPEAVFLFFPLLLTVSLLPLQTSSFSSLTLLTRTPSFPVESQSGCTMFYILLVPPFFKLSSSTSLFTRWLSFQIEGNETQRRPTTAFQAAFWKSQSRCTSLFLATWLIHTVNDLEDQRIISSTDNSPPHLPQHVISIQH